MMAEAFGLHVELKERTLAMLENAAATLDETDLRRTLVLIDPFSHACRQSAIHG
jgi:hypothetical protein